MQLLNGINLAEIEGHLRRFLALEQSSDDGFHHGLAVHWNWNADAERFVDFSGFLDQHIQNYAVDYVVGAVEKDRFDFRSRLTVPIHSSLALLKPIGIPWQVVMQDRIEMILKIDALAQAVGCHQDAMFGLRLRFDQILDESFSLVVTTTRSGHGDCTEVLPLLGESSVQLLRDILGGRNETAIDDWMKALLD